MVARVTTLADLMVAMLKTTDGLNDAGGTLHERGHDIPVPRLRQLAAGATPTRRELDALQWLGLPVRNTVEWLLVAAENDETPGRSRG